jgi:hypothetical protein
VGGVLAAGDGTTILEDDGTLELVVVVIADTCLLPFARGGMRAGMWRGARNGNFCSVKLKEVGANDNPSVSPGEELACDVAVVDDDPCSKSDNGRGLGVVTGVEESESGDEGPTGPCKTV